MSMPASNPPTRSHTSRVCITATFGM
jgi:hypothetical protein